MSPPPKITQEEAEALRKGRVAAAYREVFGADPRRRTDAQVIVWNDLQKVGNARSPVFIADASGALCPMRAAHADGRRWAWLYIEGNVEFDPQQKLQQKQKGE